jgi:hypothetical protein
MTNQDRVQAILPFGFTERQARFVALVLRHGGVCVPRQYASSAGIANGGRRCNEFFDRLVRRGYAQEIGCVHSRARLYHFHHKPLYHAIGEPTSSYRRRLSPRLAVERLMMLDAVLPAADLEWFTTASEKAAFVANLTSVTNTEGSRDQLGDIACDNGIRITSTTPIGRESGGRVVLMYLVTQVWPERFRRFLRDHASLLRVAPTWTLRLVFPRPLDRVYDTYRRVVRDELEQRNAVSQGKADPVSAEALGSGRGRVESVVLPHSYRHLSPLIDQHSPGQHSSASVSARQELRSRKDRRVGARANEDAGPVQVTLGVAKTHCKGLRGGPTQGLSTPHALNPCPQPPSDDSTLTVSEQLDRDWRRLSEAYNQQKSQRLAR